MIHPLTRAAGWLLFAAVPAALLFAALAPAAWVQAISEGGPACLFRAATTLPCPFCGITHATMSLGQDHFTEALAHHPLVIPVLALWMWAALKLARYRSRSPSKSPPSPALVVLVIAVIWAGNLIHVYGDSW